MHAKGTPIDMLIPNYEEVVKFNEKIAASETWRYKFVVRTQVEVYFKCIA